MRHHLAIIIVVGALFAVAQSARILAVVPTPSYSHQIVFKQIWRELSLLGHQVTLISTNPLNDPKLTNLTDIDISFAYDLWDNKYNISKIIEETSGNGLKFIQAMITTIHDLMNEVLKADAVKAIIRNETEHFDLVMIEYLQPTMYAFQHRFNCSFIGLTSFEPSMYVHESVGNPSHPAVHPEVLLPFSGELTFFQRLVSTLFSNVMYLYGRYVWVPWEDETVLKHFGPGYPPLDVIRKRVDMLFTNVHPVLHPARPLSPATVMIGGGIHLEAPKPLPNDLKEYLDSSEKGVIYFSLGSNVKSKDLTANTKQILMETFASIPYDVLWKFEADDLPGKPDNVRLIKWAPQQDVLRHQKIVAFISQCGLQSTDEALFSNVPVVAMPVFADQENNAKAIVNNGFGVHVDLYAMTTEALRTSILEVIENPKYRRRVRELSRLARDEPMTGLQKALWWTEYVLRNKGNLDHLKTRSVNMPAYQFFLLDVIGFCVAVIAVVVFIIFKLIKLLKKAIFGLRKKEKIQ